MNTTNPTQAQSSKKGTQLAEILQAIADIQTQAPALRVGQIVSNALPLRFNGDPFYIEDEELLYALLAEKAKLDVRNKLRGSVS